MNIGRLAGLLFSVLALSCAQDGGPVLVDAQWNLTCPAEGTTGCGSLAEKTCLGAGGQRAIVGEHRQTLCTDDPLIAICESVKRSDGTLDLTLEANVDRDLMGFPRFAFELGARIDPSTGSVASCNVTIIEDLVPYDVGVFGRIDACGGEPPSMEQPCQLSNVSIEGNQVAFDLQCDALMSSLTVLAFDVGGIGGLPASIRFSNCPGF